MQMEAGLDTGPVRLEGRTPVDGKSAGQLTAELSAMGARLMVEVLGDVERYPAVPQPEDGVTYAAKIDKAEARLDFSRTAEEVERQVRAFNPAPGAFFEVHGERVRVHAATVLAERGEAGVVIDDQMTIACSEGAIRPTLVQRAGRGVMTSEELLRGFAIPAGTRFCRGSRSRWSLTAGRSWAGSGRTMARASSRRSRTRRSR
jgi:methionyl-tRNA formyltransferase